MSVKPLVTLIKNNLWAVIVGVLSILWALTISKAESWGDQRWEKKSDASITASAVAPLPAKIEKLEIWQTEQKAAQLSDNAQFLALLEKMTSMQIKQAEGNAIMSELVKSNDRVLRRLDAQGR